MSDARYNQEYADSRADTQWNRNFQTQQYADSLAAQNRAEAKDRADTMIAAGITPPASVLSAAGYTKEYAELAISAVQAANQIAAEDRALDQAQKEASIAKTAAEANKAAAGTDSSGTSMKLTTAESMANDGLWTSNVYQALIAGGYTEADIKKKYGDDEEFQEFMRSSAKSASSSGTSTGRSGFENDYQRISAYMRAGNTSTAVTALDKVWSSLSLDQKKRVQAMLAEYGVEYSP